MTTMPRRCSYHVVVWHQRAADDRASAHNLEILLGHFCYPDALGLTAATGQVGGREQVQRCHRLENVFILPIQIVGIGDGAVVIPCPGLKETGTTRRSGSTNESGRNSAP